MPEAWVEQHIVIQRPSGREPSMVLLGVRVCGVLYTLIDMSVRIPSFFIGILGRAISETRIQGPQVGRHSLWVNKSPIGPTHGVLFCRVSLIRRNLTLTCGALRMRTRRWPRRSRGWLRCCSSGRLLSGSRTHHEGGHNDQRGSRNLSHL
jgi:hypothetical protein